MLAFLWKYTGLSKVAGWLAALAALAFVAWGMLAEAHRRGRQAERRDNLEDAVEAARKSGAIDEDVSGLSDDDLYGELHKRPGAD